MRSAIYKGYTVFEDGRVIGVKGTFLKPGKSSNGYFTVVICAEGVKESVPIHRLVAICFLDNPENKRTVNHKNGNKADNRVENLEWATDKENIRHMFDNGGGENTRKSLRRRMSKQVLDQETGAKYNSCTEAAKALGINENTLRTRLAGFRKNITSLKYL